MVEKPVEGRPEVQCREPPAAEPPSAWPAAPIHGGTRENRSTASLREPIHLGTSVVVVLSERRSLQQLRDALAEQVPAPALLVAIGRGETAFESVDRLNPAIARQHRQRSMARWLIPFGFLAGVTFTQITDLTTFSSLGSWAEPLIGGLLGLGSGWMGSYAAAASVSSEESDRIRSLRNRIEEGCWLLLIETVNGVEMPWTVLQKARPQAVVRLSEG